MQTSLFIFKFIYPLIDFQRSDPLLKFKSIRNKYVLKFRGQIFFFFYLNLAALFIISDDIYFSVMKLFWGVNVQLCGLKKLH